MNGVNFYSHAPCGARRGQGSWGGTIIDFYSHAPCGARLYRWEIWKHRTAFLLTRPIAGRDVVQEEEQRAESDFYSHAPCGARPGDTVADMPMYDFYSHAPCGARLIWIRISTVRNIFLLTRPMRGATFSLVSPSTVITFLLTRPMRGATSGNVCARIWIKISTHTPHAGRDGYRRRLGIFTHNFYSHAPCGARPATEFSLN